MKIIYLEQNIGLVNNLIKGIQTKIIISVEHITSVHAKAGVYFENNGQTFYKGRKHNHDKLIYFQKNSKHSLSTYFVSTNTYDSAYITIMLQ